MLINDTTPLSEETRNRLNELGLIHINTGGEPLTEEDGLELIQMFSQEKMNKFLKAKNPIE